MDTKWEKMYEAAKAVQNGREVSERIYAGGVAAAVESASGRIYLRPAPISVYGTS